MKPKTNFPAVRCGDTRARVVSLTRLSDINVVVMRHSESVDISQVISRKTGAKKAQESLRRGTRNLLLAAVVLLGR